MQEFWATVSIHHTSLRFKTNGRSHTLNIKNFIDMLQIFPRLPGQKFEDPPFEEEILSFIRDLGHTKEIKVLADVNVNYMHQPWRSFVAIINKFLSGKTTGLDSLRLSLLTNYFMSKDQSISRRNKMFWHTARDDPMFNTIRVISRHQDTQIYGAILPDVLTNQEMLDSKAYKEYYAVASGAEPPKAKIKYKKKADEPVTSPKRKPIQATKGTKLKSKAKVTKSDKKKQPTKKIKAKGLVVLSEVALSEAEQIKLATKRSKKDFHISHASSSDSKDEDDNDDDDESNDHDDDSDDERTESDSDEILCECKLGNDDTEMTDANQGGSEQQNVSQESRFEQEEEDAHVTLTLVLDAQKDDEPIQSSSISSDFTSKFLNLENPSPPDNEIASLMETSAPHATAIPKIT
nr:hypothetical protein [Tanacetum cinerariifolium]